MFRISKVCNAKLAGSLDNSFRRRIHNPEKIFRDLVAPGYKVFDIGCGPGTFTIDLARMAGEKGSVVAADLQKAMLEKVKKKAQTNGVAERITFHQCGQECLGLKGQADFVVGFYMVHEVPDAGKFLDEVKQLVKPGGKFLLAEPRLHVSKKTFKKEVAMAEERGFKVLETRKILFSNAVVLEKI